MFLLLGCPSDDDPPEPSPLGPDAEEYILNGWDSLFVGSYEDAYTNFHDADSLLDENVEVNMGKAWFAQLSLMCSL